MASTAASPAPGALDPLGLLVGPAPVRARSARTRLRPDGPAAPSGPVAGLPAGPDRRRDRGSAGPRSSRPKPDRLTPSNRTPDFRSTESNRAPATAPMAGVASIGAAHGVGPGDEGEVGEPDLHADGPGGQLGATQGGGRGVHHAHQVPVQLGHGPRGRSRRSPRGRSTWPPGREPPGGGRGRGTGRPDGHPARRPGTARALRRQRGDVPDGVDPERRRAAGR